MYTGEAVISSFIIPHNYNAGEKSFTQHGRFFYPICQLILSKCSVIEFLDQQIMAHLPKKCNRYRKVSQNVRNLFVFENPNE